MLRLPNPGSDFNNLINIFKELYAELYSLQPFTLDDISMILTSKNLATSSGYMGAEALRRSTRDDRTKDPLYNQSKMYSEIYRFLGWIHSIEGESLKFQFTYLGAHCSLIGDNPKPFMRECLIGVVYPNKVLNVLGGYRLRPFFTILKTMKKLGGYISRDEMILGPLSLNPDNEENFNKMIEYIKDLRTKSFSNLQSNLSKVKGSTDKVLSKATRSNNTRFPNAALLWTDWAEKKSTKNHYGRSVQYYYLTDFGETYVNKITSYIDIRETDIDSKYATCKENIIRLAFYQMLERSNFILNTEAMELKEKDLREVQKIEKSIEDNLVFSPYQEFSSKILTKYFPSLLPKNQEEKEGDKPAIKTTHEGLQLGEIISFSSNSNKNQNRFEIDLLNELMEELDKGKNLDSIISNKLESFVKSNQSEFYPLIAGLFKSLDFNCFNSQPGVNSNRFDATIDDEKYSIPIEIKSPGEEHNISTKAVRQALENKIILSSRKQYTSTKETTSLVVGYLLPNNRSEVESLINDIYKTFHFKIGIIDFHTLLKLCILNHISEEKFEKQKLENLHGYLSINTL
ncbi:hypothetical protein [Arcobacter sp. LA11]|uniref:hypothetical protein n=1 Tax=Arcobacter sp. LA11 TaxID=1898176 RepID=UPI0009348163|nr:hypothetical protein [Arcobacter sp. LA11]